MKKRCLGFIPDGFLCRYIHWFLHFYRDPFIPAGGLSRRGVVDAFAVFGLSLLASSVWFVLLLKLFIAGAIPVTEVIHPFYAVLLMLQSALVYGVVFAFSLQAVGSSMSVRFFLQVVLQSLRLYAMIMPLLVTLFFVLLTLILNDLMRVSTPLWIFWLSLLCVVWMLWLQYVIIVMPAAHSLRRQYTRRRSTVMSLAAFVVAMAAIQFATVSYNERLFDQKRFLHAAVNAFYQEGRMETSRRDALHDEIDGTGLYRIPLAK